MWALVIGTVWVALALVVALVLGRTIAMRDRCDVATELGDEIERFLRERSEASATALPRLDPPRS